jgi:hypothetical protein
MPEFAPDADARGCCCCCDFLLAWLHLLIVCHFHLLACRRFHVYAFIFSKLNSPRCLCRFLWSFRSLAEAVFLLSFLPAYTEYLSTHPHSLITKFLGTSAVLIYLLCLLVCFLLIGFNVGVVLAAGLLVCSPAAVRACESCLLGGAVGNAAVVAGHTTLLPTSSVLVRTAHVSNCTHSIPSSFFCVAIAGFHSIRLYTLKLYFVVRGSFLRGFRSLLRPSAKLLPL